MSPLCARSTAAETPTVFAVERDRPVLIDRVIADLHDHIVRLDQRLRGRDVEDLVDPHALVAVIRQLQHVRETPGFCSEREAQAGLGHAVILAVLNVVEKSDE